MIQIHGKEIKEKKMIRNFRDILALTYVGVFILWLAVVCFFLLPNIILQPESLDPTMALVAGLGIGGITQFLVVVGTLIFQFYFRKKSEGG